MNRYAVAGTPIVKKLRVSVLAGAAAMLTLAGPAAGDPDTDATFLASLRAAGLTYNSPDQAMATARSVCQLMSSGSPAPRVLDQLRTTNPGLTPDRAAQFIGIAAQSYCPDQVVPAPRQ